MLSRPPSTSPGRPTRPAPRGRVGEALWALKAALEDVPRQAKRLMRWQARRRQIQTLKPIFATPLRPGNPPGYRQKPTHEVDRVLKECNWLAYDAMRTDTS